jgi:hypothetical protein
LTQARHYQQTSKIWVEIVKRIRSTEGFAHFLKTVSFNILQKKASVEGPVIIVNVSECRFNAIIVHDSDPTTIFPFPTTGVDAIFESRPTVADDFVLLKSPYILRILWGIIVELVVEQLEMIRVEK